MIEPHLINKPILITTATGGTVEEEFARLINHSLSSSNS